MNELVAHQQHLLFRDGETATLTGFFPIHPVGAAIFWFNASDSNVTVSVEHSDDGTSWSTIAGSSKTVVALGWAYAFVQSTKKYVRLVMGNTAASDGVRVYISQPQRDQAFADLVLAS